MLYTLLLSICFLILHVSCENFSIPVYLNTQSNAESYLDDCDQLISLGKTIWDDGVFSDCVSESRIDSNLDRYVLSYNIFVNSDKIRTSQKVLDFIEVLAVVNRYLNYNTRKCATHTGPNWNLGKEDEAQPFKVMTEVAMTWNQSATRYCEYVNKYVLSSTGLQILRGCYTDSAVFSKNGVRQLFALKLRRNPSIMMPSSNVFLVMQQVSNAVNEQIPGCVKVTRVVMTEDCSVAFISLKFTKQMYDERHGENLRNIDGCDEMRRSSAIVFTLEGYTNCRVTDLPLRQNDFMIYSVVIQKKMDSKSKQCYDVFNEVEISLRAEAQFNSGVVNCLNYNINLYQKIHDDNFTANVYGPLNASLCNMFQGEPLYHQLFDACTMGRWRNATFYESSPALYRLRLKQPIFEFDLPLYNKWLSSTLTKLNLPHSQCKFNGYVGRINSAIQNIQT